MGTELTMLVEFTTIVIFKDVDESKLLSIISKK
jgi:hypothetical protein